MPDADYVRDAFSRIAGRYQLTNHLLSLGIDTWWRDVVARRVAGWKPRTILDVATGTGDLALDLARHCPDCAVTGSDFCPEMLEGASRRGVNPTVVADACRLPFADRSFDVVTVAFGLRNMADRLLALTEMHRVLNVGGHLVILDFSMPEGLLRIPYGLYLEKVMPAIAGRVTGHRDAYEYLCTSIGEFPSGKAMTGLLGHCGFTETACRPLTCGIVSVYQGTRP
jgi:demethylmenaquinone methyltransferase/2-methoxy-6-polyprenyl-1,4-benzoquinol methylase